jgi:hypothetical protein
MKRVGLLSLGLVLLLSACGAPAPYVVTVTPEMELTSTETPAAEPPTAEAPAILNTAETTPVEATATETATAEPTSTPAPSFTPVLPTPTETLLPPLELPTERRNPPALVAWTGLPTYPGDSDPGLLFRVDYDPDLWAQTEGNFGGIVLGHRGIEYCTLTPWSGRGLPGDWKVEHEFRYIGSAAFDVNTVTFQGEVKFVSYVGGDRHVLTGFQVSFMEQKDQCLQDAEAVFGTLRSFAAQPTVTPTFTPETPTPPALTAEITPTP